MVKLYLILLLLVVIPSKIFCASVPQGSIPADTLRPKTVEKNQGIDESLTAPGITMIYGGLIALGAVLPIWIMPTVGALLIVVSIFYLFLYLFLIKKFDHKLKKGSKTAKIAGSFLTGVAKAGIWALGLTGIALGLLLLLLTLFVGSIILPWIGLGITCIGLTWLILQWIALKK